MGRVAVVTDSTHYLPSHLVESHEIHQVSLYVTWKGKSIRETEIDNFTTFYDYLRSTPEIPTTSQPSVGDFIQKYQPLLDANRDIVSIHLSAGISGTSRSAQQAKNHFIEEGLDPARISVLDSATACGALGIMVLAATNAASRGCDANETSAAAIAAREGQKTRFAVDSLDYLRRGGRIGTAQAWLGSALKIKPILTLDHTIEAIERVRTSTRAFERMVDYLDERHKSGCDLWFVQHIQAEDQAEALVKRGREIYGCPPSFVSEIGPVIGSHIGPGLLGVSGAHSKVIGPI